METQTTPRRAARHDRDPRRDDLRPRRTTLLVLFMAFVVLVGAIVWAGNYYAGCKAAPEASKQTVNFTVPDGASAGDVVDALESEGLINCSGFVGNLLMRGTGKTDQIRAGDYQLNPGMTLDEIVTVLTTAPKKIPTTSVLIPPGYRLTQIASTLQTLDHGIGEEAVPELGVLQRLLVEARRRVGDNVGVIGGVAETLVVGVARVAGVREQEPPPLGRLHCALQHLPGHHL